MKDQKHEARVRRSVRRLTIEARNLRGDFAAWKAWRRCGAAGGWTANLFLQGTGPALQSDLLIRLIRILDLGLKTASFWYLYRCGLSAAGDGVDFAWLKDFSTRLKSIRDKVFVHIDKEAVFDPQKYYEEAKINDRDIAGAIEQVWTVLGRLNSSYGETPGNVDNQSLESLCLDFERDLLRLVSR